MKTPCALLTAFTVALGVAPAKDLFDVQASSRSPFPLQQSASYNDVLSAVQDVANAQGRFSNFQNRDYTAALNYLGVRNAASLTISGNGTQADLDIPLDGRRKTFFGPNRRNLYRQIRDYLLRGQGASILADIGKAANQQSAVAITDGNPSSTTALLAARTFNDFGSLWDRNQFGANDAKGNSIGIVFDAGEFRAEGHEGRTYGLPIMTHFRLSDRVSLKAQIPLQYIDLEGASLYQAGIILDVPTRVLMAHEGQPWDWQVMPTFAFAVSGSKELAAGGGLLAGALTNVVSYNCGKFTLTYANYLSFFEGVDLSIGNYDFQNTVDQRIMKNGLRVSVPVDDRWLFEAYGIHTQFFRSAAVSGYFTLGATVGYRAILGVRGKPVNLGYLTLGIYSEVGNHYSSGHVQVGTAWKF